MLEFLKSLIHHLNLEIIRDGATNTIREKETKLVNIKDASEWGSQYLSRRVTISNISYLLQYGRITKYGNNGNPLINIEELKDYYDSFDKENSGKKN